MCVCKVMEVVERVSCVCVCGSDGSGGEGVR